MIKEIIHSLKGAIHSRWFPWILLGIVFLYAVLHEIIQTDGFIRLLRSYQTWFLAIGILGLLVGIFASVWLIWDLSNRKNLSERVILGETKVSKAYQRLEAISQISQQFVNASDENEVIQPALKFLVELVDADGASFVPLDDHGQPQAAISHGQLPIPMMNAWVEYLATPEVRQRCQNCELETKHNLEKPIDCPLLQGPLTESINMLCLTVVRGEREFGVINLYLSRIDQLDAQTQSYLRTLIEEMALGLDSIRMRRRELSALRQFELVRQRSDLKALLTTLLENIQQNLDADCAFIMITGKSDRKSNIRLSHEGTLCKSTALIESLLQGVVTSGEPLLLGEVAGDPHSQTEPYSLLAVPLISPTERDILGAILVGNQNKNRFHKRQLALLQTMAGQIALVVENSNLVSEISYKTMMQERTRLAREIHDGLAQTLGFLKLHVAQLRNLLARGEHERSLLNAESMYTALSEAYQDARQAIDGLRISPSDCGLTGWLEQIALEFADLSGIQVDIQEISVQTELPAEYHAQLIRIVQEVLSNVRKHSGADRVGLYCRENGSDIVIEVHDNGIGFLPQETMTPSQYGLKGMRERADLIGADLQVISQPKEGTTVRVRLPIKDIDEVM